MRQPRHTLTALTFAGFVGVALGSGCTEPKATEFVAGVTTQMQVPKDLKAVGLFVSRDGKPLLCKTYPVTGDGYVLLPSTSGMFPLELSTSPVNVAIFGFREAPEDFETDCIVASSNVSVGQKGISVLRRSRSTFVPDKILYLPMPLRQACTQVQCPETQTCKAGECVVPEVDSTKLQPYSDSLYKGDANTCFQGACFADGARVSLTAPLGSPILKTIDAAKCVFEYPHVDTTPAPAGINVRLTHDNFATEILDLDAEEGFTIPDAGKPFQFQLAPGLCDTAYKKGKIVGIDATPLCQSKTALQPICTKDLNLIVYGNEDGKPKDVGEALCPTDETLTPAPALLYVLMDRSQSMAKLYQDNAIEKFLKYPLQDRSLSNTRVAFKFLPAQTTDCNGASNGYGNPTAPADIPFTVAADTADALATLLATSPVLPDNPPLNLGAALKAGGVYKAFDNWVATQPAPAPVIGRRYVIVIGQKDFTGTCAGGKTPITLASEAAASTTSPVSTNVLLVKNPDPSAPDTSADAAALATAGGTTLVDARTDPTRLSQALFDTAADLGSCLYEVPKTFDITQAKETSKLSYYDLINHVQVDIPYAATCGKGDATADGWNVEGSRVRVCGTSCTSLRTSVSNAGVYNSAQAEGTPGIAMKVSRPCNATTATP